jgi:hypothetical protein
VWLSAGEESFNIALSGELIYMQQGQKNILWWVITFRKKVTKWW